jgi:CheY-like chemotaxis protein
MTSLHHSPLAALDRGVLIVEDDPELQSQLARMATNLGARVVGTPSGQAALALAAEWPLGVVLLDESLPGGSGIDVARRLLESQRDLLIVLMVERDEPALFAAAMAAGITRVVLKPVDADTLRAAIFGVAPYELAAE